MTEPKEWNEKKITKENNSGRSQNDKFLDDNKFKGKKILQNSRLGTTPPSVLV